MQKPNHPLTIGDIDNALIFFNRVNIEGKEAVPMADLQMKMSNMRQELMRFTQWQQQQMNKPPAEDPPEDPPADPPPAAGKKAQNSKGEKPTEH